MPSVCLCSIGSFSLFFGPLRVEFLLKTDSGYPNFPHSNGTQSWFCQFLLKPSHRVLVLVWKAVWGYPENNYLWFRVLNCSHGSWPEFLQNRHFIIDMQTRNVVGGVAALAALAAVRYVWVYTDSQLCVQTCSFFAAILLLKHNNACADMRGPSLLRPFQTRCMR